MPAEQNITGTKHVIESPLRDGLNKVRQRFPSALPEGSSAHWSYRVGSHVVGEAWMGRTRWHLVLANTPLCDMPHSKDRKDG